jgi:hypothetical protein
MPKTATKTIQWRIFSRHSEIYYLGRFDGSPFQGKYIQYNGCRDESVFRIMDEIVYTGFESPEIPKCRELLKHYLAKHNQNGLVPVFSWESFTTDSRGARRYRAQNLKQTFGDAKIVVTIRHPVSLLESAFLQQLKRDNIGGGFKRGRGVFYSTVDKWVKRDLKGNVSDHLDYPETIKMYVKQFGRGNVYVLVFEDLLKDKTAYYERLCDFIGINSQEALDLVSENKDNSRWADIQIKRLQEIASSPVDSIRFRFSDREERKRQLDLDKSGESLNFDKKARVEISKNVRAEVLAQTRPGNKWLDKVFDLDLARHGYYE